MLFVESARGATLSGDHVDFGLRSPAAPQAAQNVLGVDPAVALAIQRELGAGSSDFLQVDFGASPSALPDGRGVKYAVRAGSSRPRSEMRELRERRLP